MKLKPYPEYKDSGVSWLGKVPEGWILEPGFSAFSPQKIKNTNLIEKTVLSLSYGKIVVKPPEKLHGLVPESFETYQIINPGNIIIRVTDLQNDKTSLRVGISINRGIITSAYLCLVTKTSMLPDYGYLLLHAYDLKKIYYGMGSGLRQNLDFSDIKRMPILIPPLNEQNRIAAYIEGINKKISHFIRGKHRLIELLKEQKQAMINQAVTRGLDPNVRLKPSGIKWLGDIPEHWEVRRVRQIVKTVKTGGTPSGADEKYFKKNGFNWYTPGDFNDSLFLDKSERQLSELGSEKIISFPPSTIMMIGIGATIGKVALTKMKAGCNQQINGIITNKKIIPEFLAYYFRCIRQFIIACGKYTTIPIINQEETKNLPVFLPIIHEQLSIVSFLDEKCSAINTAITRAEREIELIREYRTRLIADVVTGKVDVRHVPVEHSPDIQELDDTDFNGEPEEPGDTESSTRQEAREEKTGKNKLTNMPIVSII